LPLIVALGLPVSTEPEPDTALVIGICRRCGAAAGWPRTGWSSRLMTPMAPVLRRAWGVDFRVVDVGSLGPAGTA
jgi:hypothetical protein